MATCPRVVKCAAAALAALVVVIGAWWTIETRKEDAIKAEAAALVLRIETDQAAQDAAAVLRVKDREGQIKELVGDIAVLKLDTAVIKAVVVRIERRLEGKDMTAIVDGHEPKLKG